MRGFATLAFLTALPFAALAEDEKVSPPPQIFEGLDELAEGLRNLFNQLEQDVTPFMEHLGEQLRDLDRYHPPEVLPNGDIIIRRKTPEVVPAPTVPEAEDPIEI